MIDEKNVVHIYTDGACSGNPGRGGWAALLIYNGYSRTIKGSTGKEITTNSRMEVMAVFKALEKLTRPCNVKVYSDSAYVVNTINEKWYEKWIKNKDGKAHLDLWEDISKLLKIHKVEAVKVKGHSGDKNNELVDRIAVAEIDKE